MTGKKKPADRNKVETVYHEDEYGPLKIEAVAKVKALIKDGETRGMNWENIIALIKARLTEQEMEALTAKPVNEINDEDIRSFLIQSKQ